MANGEVSMTSKIFSNKPTILGNSDVKLPGLSAQTYEKNGRTSTTICQVISRNVWRTQILVEFLICIFCEANNMNSSNNEVDVSNGRPTFGFGESGYLVRAVLQIHLNFPFLFFAENC